MELPPWLKVESPIKNLNLSRWFKDWFKTENKNHIETQTYIEKIEMHTGLVTSIDEDRFTKGLYVLSLVKEQVDAYGSFVNDFYEKVEGKHGNQITRNALTMLQGAVFAIGTKTQRNPEWREHCASSLREIFHEWDGFSQFNNDFVLVFRDKNGGLDSSESEQLNSFWLLYNYFSGIDHHEVSKVMHSLRALLKDSSLKPGDCYKEEMFIERVKDFFSKLSWMMEISKKRTRP